MHISHARSGLHRPLSDRGFLVKPGRPCFVPDHGAIATAVGKYAPHTVRAGFDTGSISAWHWLHEFSIAFCPSWRGRCADPEEKRRRWKSINSLERRF